MSKEKKEYSGKLLLRMPKSLHRELHDEAEAEGTSLNQYIMCLLSSKAEAYENLLRVEKFLEVRKQKMDQRGRYWHIWSMWARSVWLARVLG